MPYATRQGVINFPKKKLVTTCKAKNVSTENTKTIPEDSVTLSSSARKAFHGCSCIVGREKEIEKVTEFLTSHLNSQTSGSIYISGLPGTGKTACINYILNQKLPKKEFQLVKINCTSFNSSKAVFKRISEELHLKNIGKIEKDAINSIEKYLLRKHKMIILILDEIDQLETKSQSVLYTIFGWPSLNNSKFLLIGIANAMDLTDRYLPRLQAKDELKPVLLHFAPYSKNEIANILKTRLTEAGADKIFAPGAIELISAKVAGTSGDVRRALDLGRRVIEVAEHNQGIQSTQGSVPAVKLENIFNDSTKKSPLKSSYRTPNKLELLVNRIIDTANTPPKRKLNFSQVSPQKNSLSNLEASPQKLMKTNASERIHLSEIELNKINSSSDICEGNKILKKSPRKINMKTNEDQNLMKMNHSVANQSEEKSLKAQENGCILRSSPRKLNFDINSKDVLTVVKSVFGSSKNFKPSEESSFPLHQKLLICSLLLMIQKGKKKDLNVGKLHQVYSKVCSKRGLMPVDKSGFIFLCRQVEVTGIIQIGKGQGALVKVSLQWDESEVTDSIKDLNLLSSILNDVSCLS